MKLYQGLTQVQINEEFAGEANGYKITTTLEKPLNYEPAILYQYLDAVLKPGSRHDQIICVMSPTPDSSVKITIIKVFLSPHI